MRGCMACAEGQRRSANPHAADTPQWSGWQRGWMDEFARLPAPLRESRLKREPDLLAPGTFPQ